MRIDFDDKSYVEIKKTQDKIIIIIQAIDHNDKMKKVINAVEITSEQFKSLISDI